MDSPQGDVRLNRRVMVCTALAMYSAALLDGLIEGFLPGDPKFSMLPVVVVLAIVVALGLVGTRLPRRALALLGPLGVALVAYALATTPGTGDAAVLYALPVVWTTFFFGRRGGVAILACLGVAHALALLSLPAASAYPGRWVDVMVSAVSIAAVVLMLEERNRAYRTAAREEARAAAAARDAAVEASNAKSTSQPGRGSAFSFELDLEAARHDETDPRTDAPSVRVCAHDGPGRLCSSPRTTRSTRSSLCACSRTSVTRPTWSGTAPRPSTPSNEPVTPSC
jgi:hypothetical protein